MSQPGKMDSDSRALSLKDATLYRRLVAKLNYLAMDRPDIRYAASIMGSHASSPKDTDLVTRKRVGRFLIKRPITWTHYIWCVRSDHIMSYTDSDWAASREDRRSVSGGMLVKEGRRRCRFRRGTTRALNNAVCLPYHAGLCCKLCFAILSAC